jgi:soluble epoxide hydrolase/lipid-phosphate phosphatase
LGPKLPSDLPVLFIYGTEDNTTTKHLIATSKKFIANLRSIALEGTGHWVLVERKDEVTETVANWITENLENSNSKAKL